MATATTSIAWTNRTWNPVRGCSRVSEGCRNCYAEKVAARFSGDGQPFAGFATRSPHRWTGQVALVEDALLAPLSWRKPARVFVNSMSDLFHESLPDEAIDRVFAVMALAPRHTFQILTKRPERMRAYFTESRRNIAVYNAATVVAGGDFDKFPGAMAWKRSSGEGWWPLPNVWLGVSAEDQRAADERIPLLLQTPAAVRFVSAEPLLGAVDLGPWLGHKIHRVPWVGAAPSTWADVVWPPWVPEKVRKEIVEFWAESCGRGPRAYQANAEARYNNAPPFGAVVRLTSAPSEYHEGRWVHCWNNMGRLIRDDGSIAYVSTIGYAEEPQRRIDWVIGGGESGPGARPCDIAWIRGIVGQCKAAGVACFVKQLGARPGYPKGSDVVKRLPPPGADALYDFNDGWYRWRLRDRKGGDPAEWPADLRVREFPREEAPRA